MATFKRYERLKNFSTRPFSGEICGTIWYVEKGQEYDLIQIKIEEIERYFWDTHLAVPCNTSEETVEYLCKKFVETIDEKDVLAYKGFLEDGEKWGWD